MKARTLLQAFVLFYAVLSIEASYAESGKGLSRCYYMPSKTEELEGTWTAKGDPWAKTDQKLVFYWWGYFETFRFADDKTPSAKGTSTIVDKWIDDGGSVWYKEFCRFDWSSRTVIFRIIKISDDARMWESVQSTIDFPAPGDLSAADRREKGYKVFYRQELESCCH